jgi:HD-GYP domain-containing protein (c-di-GMP phosphodiesterase class II)
MRSTYLGGHSRGVAALCAEAAAQLGHPPADVAAVRRTGLVHDLGRVGVSAAVWGKPGPLTRAEREQVRLHPYQTERILARPGWLAALGRPASQHHERLARSGYFRACTAAELPPPARLLAAADVLHAMGEPRPHRQPLPLPLAAAELRAEARAGRLDGDCVEALLACAGEAPRRRRQHPSGLTAREIEVLRLLARGHTKAQIARELVIAPKTADAHTQHIYAKLGVSTRSGATLIAMQHGLLETLPAAT